LFHNNHVYTRLALTKLIGPFKEEAKQPSPPSASVIGGRLPSKVVSNGFGKSESKPELTVVEEDSEELRSVSEANYVDKLFNQLRMVNGTKSNANSHLEETRFNLKPPELITSLSHLLRSTLLLCQEVQ
jgi:hypothetical protein